MKTLYDENNYAKVVFDDGLTLISQHMPNLKSISVGVWILIGSRNENPRNAGICHFIEHTVFKGTRKRNSLQIAKALENVGGTLNAFTSKEHTCYYANTLSEDLPLALDVIADLVSNATFFEKDMDREKQVIIEEIKDTEDSPEEFIQDCFYEQLFHGHSLGYRILGTRETVSAFTRREIEAFYRRFYVPANMVISIAGNFDPKTLSRLVRSKFRFSKNLINRAYWPSGIRPYHYRLNRGRVVHYKKNIAQAHVCIGTPLRVSYLNSRKFKLLAFNTILGGGMSSRLFQRVREKYGLAYSIYSFVDFMYDGGVFGIYLATDKANVQRTIDLVKSELSRFGTAPIRRHELRMAKAQIKANLLFGLESTSTRMIRLAKNEIYLKKKLSISDITNYIDKITVEDLQELAASLSDRIASLQTSILQ